MPKGAMMKFYPLKHLPLPTRLTPAGLADAAAALRRTLSHLPGQALPQALRGAAGIAQPGTAPQPSSPDRGFVTRSFSNPAGSRQYKLYIPSSYRGQPATLLVMLHGCTQSPDDFAAGTQMNRAAEAHGLIVAYPAQSSAANRQKCWNWFNPADQQRDTGEPSLIAGITRQVMHDFAIDPARIYVAGLSAGGAAASIMANAYPELYAAVGVHSGLPCGAARDMQSAFTAMQRGGDAPPQSVAPRPVAPRPAAPRLVPTIVFHGQRDTTVNPRNADAVVAQTIGGRRLATQVETGQAPSGHAYTKTVWIDDGGDTLVEQWIVQGAGHAWFGGSPDGSFTDPRGPDATAEMLRFFRQHPGPANRLPG